MTTKPAPPVELPAEISVINMGLPLFADALREQGVPVQPVDWRIPAGGDLELVAALEELYGPRSDAIETANAEVVRRLDEGVPQLVDVAPAATCFPAAGAHVAALRPGRRLDRRGRPASAVDAGCGGGRGLGRRRRGGGPAARATGAIGLEPAYRYDAVVPMASARPVRAGLMVVDNTAGNTRAFAPMNQGAGRYGLVRRDTPAAIKRLIVFGEVAGPMIRAVVQATQPIDLLGAGGARGSDRRRRAMRTQGTTKVLVGSILPALAALPTRADGLRPASGGNHMFFLNLAMAAAKSVALWAEQVTGSSIVTTMCRNGTAYGMRSPAPTRCSGARRHQSPTPVLRGSRPRERRHGRRRQRHLELVGLGGAAAAGSPAVAGFVGGTMAEAVAITGRWHRSAPAAAPVQAAYVGQRRHAARCRCSSSRRDRDDAEDYHWRPARQFRRRTDQRRSRDRACGMLPGRGTGARRASIVILDLLLPGDDMAKIISQEQRSRR